MSGQWGWLSNIWNEVVDVGSTAAGYLETGYDAVSDYASDTYDDYFTDYSKDSMSNYFTTDRGSSTSSYLETAMDAVGGFLDIAAAPSKPGDNPQANMRRISGKSGVGTSNYQAGKSSLANPKFGYTPRVENAIIQANASKVPSIELAIAQMKNYRGGGATIRLQGNKPISVASRTKKPSFAPKYYGK